MIKKMSFRSVARNLLPRIERQTLKINMKKITLVLLSFCLLTSFKPKELTWVAIGDSITYLNDHKNETQERLTRGYLTQVTEELQNIRYVNKGYNG